MAIRGMEGIIHLFKQRLKAQETTGIMVSFYLEPLTCAVAELQTRRATQKPVFEIGSNSWSGPSKLRHKEIKECCCGQRYINWNIDRPYSTHKQPNKIQHSYENMWLLITTAMLHSMCLALQQTYSKQYILFGVKHEVNQ